MAENKPSNQPKAIAHNTPSYHRKLHMFQILKSGTREGDRLKLYPVLTKGLRNTCVIGHNVVLHPRRVSTSSSPALVRLFSDTRKGGGAAHSHRLSFPLPHPL